MKSRITFGFVVLLLFVLTLSLYAADTASTTATDTTFGSIIADVGNTCLKQLDWNVGYYHSWKDNADGVAFTGTKLLYTIKIKQFNLPLSAGLLGTAAANVKSACGLAITANLRNYIKLDAGASYNFRDNEWSVIIVPWTF